MRPVYRGAALIEIRLPVSPITLGGAVPVIAGQQREYFETQSRILGSRSVALAVIDRLHLRSDPEFSGARTQRGFLNGLRQIAAAISRSADDPSAPHDAEWELQTAFLEHVEVSPVRDSNLVQVSFDSFTPELAARGANAIVEEFVRLNDKRRFQSASGAKTFLEAEIAIIEDQLEASERALNDFARQHKVVDVDESMNLGASRISQLTKELTDAVGARIAAESLYQQIKNSSQSGLPSEIENEVTLSLKDSLARSNAMYMRLSRIYKENYPKLRQIAAKIAEDKRSLEREVQAVVASAAADYEKARRREGLLRQELEAEKTTLLDVKDRAVQYHILQREWETNRQLHAGLLEQMKNIDVAGTMEMDNVSVIDRAQVPPDPHKPKLVVNAGIALGLGSLLGLALAFVLAYLDDVVRTPEQFEGLTGVASLGTVPKFESVSLGVDEKLERIADSQRESSIAEAMRLVRLNLEVLSERTGARLLQVTSAAVGEGKTTTAANLAVVLAQRGSRVLLVDADLRRPRLHEVFGVPLSPGLGDALEGKSGVTVHKTDVANLSLLTAGGSTLDPEKALGTVNMEVLTEGASEAFDFVILDSAPILGIADSTTVGTRVDGVIIVVSAEQGRERAVREAVRRLRLVGAPLLGGVLNMTDVTRHSYSYYGRYYYRRDSFEAGEQARPASA
jgi:capsular exopolysaccharide synthesis family protein